MATLGDIDRYQRQHSPRIVRLGHGWGSSFGL
jgi:hypothetical protein